MSRRQAELEGISWLSICQNATGQIARPSSVSPMSWPLLLTQADPSSPQYSMVTFCVSCGDFSGVPQAKVQCPLSPLLSKPLSC